MPRSIWNGTVAFGLVRVPVKLYSATESKRIPLRERHAPDGAAIEHRRLCVKEGREVPYSEIVKGYEVSAGSYVVLTKEEIAAAEGPEAHVVEIEHFVDREQIDPAFYERAYYLGPGKLGEDSYRLLHAALERSARVGIGRFVFHNKAHLVAIRARGGCDRVAHDALRRRAGARGRTGDRHSPTSSRASWRWTQPSCCWLSWTGASSLKLCEHVSRRGAEMIERRPKARQSRRPKACRSHPRAIS